MNPPTRRMGTPLGPLGRWLVAGWGLLLVGCFAVAGSLDPDPRGYGTHRQFGLPPCTFRQVFDMPCPNCGMTTSISHFTHGQPIASLRAHPGGLLLAMLCAVQIPWCAVSAYQGRLWRVTRLDFWLAGTLAVLLGVNFGYWLLRVLF